MTATINLNEDIEMREFYEKFRKRMKMCYRNSMIGKKNIRSHILKVCVKNASKK